MQHGLHTNSSGLTLLLQNIIEIQIKLASQKQNKSGNYSDSHMGTFVDGEEIAATIKNDRVTEKTKRPNTNRCSYQQYWNEHRDYKDTIICKSHWKKSSTSYFPYVTRNYRVQWSSSHKHSCASLRGIFSSVFITWFVTRPWFLICLSILEASALRQWTNEFIFYHEVTSHLYTCHILYTSGRHCL